MKKRFDTEPINQVRKPRLQITKVILGYYAWLDKLSVISHDLDVVASNGENIAVENTYGRFDNIAKADIEKIRVWENSDYPSERMFMAAVYTYMSQVEAIVTPPPWYNGQVADFTAAIIERGI